MKILRNLLDKLEPHFTKGGKLERLYPLYEAMDTFLYVPGTKTSNFPHVRDSVDMKRVMISVVTALVPCVLMGAYNVGFQALRARGLPAPAPECLLLGLQTILPIIIVSYAVGGFWEVLFATIRKHEINEGFLVTGLLFPLTLPPTIPLWQVALGMSFGVVIGKEVFGGTGMNILNPALTARAFIFFAYPGNISGDQVWVAVNPAKESLIDGYSGATPLLVASNAGRGTEILGAYEATTFSWKNMFVGLIPGSIGETSTLACLLGAAFLILLGIASWRIMAGMLAGAYVMVSIMNSFAGPEGLAFLALPYYYHIVMGGFAFGLVYMATDPVSAAYTNKGKWIYGIAIGVLAILIRILNPAYPEGTMLAILFMNVFAPLVDHFVVQSNIAKRLKRYGKK